MAGSFMARLRERMEQLQTELQPEAAGFDRRAYGYEDEEEDATFEEIALDEEEESPWRRPGSGEARAAPAPDAAQGRPEARAPESPPRAASAYVSRARRREAFDSFGVGGRQSGGALRRDAPSAPTREAPMPGRVADRPAAARSSSPRELGRAGTRGSTRLQRFRGRIHDPDSLRELFLLREVIDRPIALRRPRPRTRPPS